LFGDKVEESLVAEPSEGACSFLSGSKVLEGGATIRKEAKAWWGEVIKK